MLITFESETTGIRKEFGEDKFDSVVPSVSLLAEFPVAIVDKVVDKHGIARAGQVLSRLPLHAGRPEDRWPRTATACTTRTVAAEFKDKFPEVRLVTVEDVFGGWDKVQAEHFASGALLDQIYGER